MRNERRGGSRGEGIKRRVQERGGREGRSEE